MEKKVGLQLISIYLKEASFFREDVIPTLPEEDFENKLNIELKSIPEKDNISKLSFTLEFFKTHKEQVLVRSKITHIGIFKYPQDLTKEQLDGFMTINAPAIIFPFTREVLANLSIKAYLYPILLEPINFVLYAKKNAIKSES